MRARSDSALSVLLCCALGACSAAPPPAASAVSATSTSTASAPSPSIAAPEPHLMTAAPAPATAHRDGPGWLGVALANPEQQSGALIRTVMRGSPAERAGLLGGDVVVTFDGESIDGPRALRQRVTAARSGARVSLGVLRGDQTRLFAIELEAAPDNDELMRKSYVGARAPEFGALDTVQGSITPSLPGLKGRVVVLEFWASWCGICHVLAPTLNGWHDRYSAQGVTVLGVTTDPVDLAGRTAGELGMGYPLASDSSGKMLQAYRAFALPTLFVIDKQGNVRDVLIGYSTPRLREIEQLVQKLIAEG
jgi:peroxiredoxin